MFRYRHSACLLPSSSTPAPYHPFPCTECSRARRLTDLNYVPVFFPNADLSGSPAIARYMQRCAKRPTFTEAFGEQHASLVLSKTEAWIAKGPGSKGGNPVDMFKGLLG